jgi:hypothetical protein
MGGSLVVDRADERDGGSEYKFLGLDHVAYVIVFLKSIIMC